MNHVGALRTLLFHRDYRSFTGGHLKVFHYFLHAQESNRFRPRIHFTSDSVRGPENPWHAVTPPPIEAWRPAEADVLFLAGGDWEAVPDPAPAPVINLIQGVRHADLGNPLRAFLTRRAVRICVSQEVADAISATGLVNGPVQVIPNGIDLENIPTSPVRDIEMLVVGLKNPTLAAAAATALRKAGLAVTLLQTWLPRARFLELLSRSRVALLLPKPREGFYLPALEAMAAGAIVVCPDCVGNRGFCREGDTAFRPPYLLDEIVAAAIAASAKSDPGTSAMRDAALAESHKHSLAAERAAFLRILDAM